MNDKIHDALGGKEEHQSFHGGGMENQQTDTGYEGDRSVSDDSNELGNHGQQG